MKISKRNKLLNLLSNSSHISQSNQISSTNPDLAQQFTFPIDRIHAILSKEIFFFKLDLFVTIYLVNILEHICKDILRLTTCYVQYQEKYSINKSDVAAAIQADTRLTKVFYFAENPGLPSTLEDEFSNSNESKFEFNNPDDDFEDEIIFRPYNTG